MNEQTQKLLTTIAENVPKVKQQGYDEGKQAEYDAFWDSLQGYGNRTAYAHGFRNWGSEYIRPKYKVIPKTASPYLFSDCTSLKALEKEYFDFSQIPENYTEYNQGLYALCNRCSSLEIVEDVNFQPIMSYAYFFAGCINLKTIEVLRVSEKSGFGGNSGGDCFSHCTALENVRFEGVIGKSISFQLCPLTVESMKSIITHLKNYTGVTDTSGASLEMKYTLTLKDSCRTELEAASFTDEDKRLLEENGIVFTNETTWTSVIGDLKWNLVWATA